MNSFDHDGQFHEPRGICLPSALHDSFFDMLALCLDVYGKCPSISASSASLSELAELARTEPLRIKKLHGVLTISFSKT